MQQHRDKEQFTTLHGMYWHSGAFDVMGPYATNITGWLIAIYPYHYTILLPYISCSFLKNTHLDI